MRDEVVGEECQGVYPVRKRTESHKHIRQERLTLREGGMRSGSIKSEYEVFPEISRRVRFISEE